jgi:putative ABC transport system substrate-binding protein
LGDGRNVRMDLRWGGSDINRIRAHAQELVGLQPDIIVTNGAAPTGAVQRETRTIPIVFANVGDPVASGIVARLDRPSKNVTGFGDFGEASLGGKRVELLSEVAPGLKRAAIMFDPDQPAASFYLSSLETAARSLKVALITAPVHSDAEIETAITTLAREPGGGLFVMPDVFTTVHRAPIISVRPETTCRRSMRYLTLSRTAACSPADPTGPTPFVVPPPISIAFYAARSKAIYRCSFRQNLRWP